MTRCPRCAEPAPCRRCVDLQPEMSGKATLVVVAFAAVIMTAYNLANWSL